MFKPFEPASEAASTEFGKILIFRLILLLAMAPFTLNPSHAFAGTVDGPVQRLGGEIADWKTDCGNGSTMGLDAKVDEGREAIEVQYGLSNGGWVEMHTAVPDSYQTAEPITFWVKNEGAPSDLEIKFVAANGSVFGRKVSLRGRYPVWSKLSIYLGSLEYWWDGDGKFDGLATFSLALSGGGSGRLLIADAGIGPPGLAASFPPLGPLLDPDRDLPGFGPKARRSQKMAPEDPLVLKYLNLMQDSSSPERALMPSQEDDQAQLFNNSIVAIAFILKGEKERAERILDFYAGRMDKGNQDIRLQNFYYRGEARGFYQHVLLRGSGTELAYRDNDGHSDRWMGDMAWLLIAGKYYDRRYPSHRYEGLTDALYALLVSWFKDDGAGGGYVQHGWRDGDDHLHEKSGHPEGNIDCYAAFNLMGDTVRAAKIRLWFNRQIGEKNNEPLDLYTWRVLAFGAGTGDLLNIPEFDFRYRKTVEFNGRGVTGFYHSANPDVQNIWTDGLGHMACAQIAYGDRHRGYYYANQMDLMLIDRNIGGQHTRALPYTANQTGGFDWVKTDEGFTSCCAWYIFAKNGFNPYTCQRS